MRKDFAMHKLWMMRYAGSMWGIFLVFRLMFLLIGPLLTVLHLPAGSMYNWCSWTSGEAPIVVCVHVTIFTCCCLGAQFFWKETPYSLNVMAKPSQKSCITGVYSAMTRC